VVVALGSSLGDRAAAIADAARRISGFLQNFRLGPIIETVPVGDGLEHDPLFLNTVGVGESALPASELLGALRAIEAAAGRVRPYPGAPRTLDLDLILVGGEVIDEPGLQVPHPRFRDRLFVLEPLVEVAPGIRDPVTHLTARELLDRKRADA
jgi:2-amino-4-hydroxy-6-hydroxymethyldihydropteridine diphosphokinase